MPVEQVAITVTAEAECISIIRRFVTSAGRLLGPTVDMDVVALLTSELTANAVELGAGEVVVTVRCTDDRRLRVEVRDFGYGLPQVQHPGAVEPGGGRGLLIVDQLADTWGVDQFLPGKIVWFELASPEPSGGSDLVGYSSNDSSLSSPRRSTSVRRMMRDR